uniref:Uncharacterized protein n=1 Tax=Arundo donax TaxID=35708 RepID=A0A0A8ZWB1_ARUDO
MHKKFVVICQLLQNPWDHLLTEFAKSIS